MADDNSPDGPLRGGEGPGEAHPRTSPPWLVPVVVSVIGGFFILLNGWFAYIASGSKDLMEARNKALTQQVNDLKERVNRLDDRVIFLEQNRNTAATQDESGAGAVVWRGEDQSSSASD